jgi:hypothetical protein
MVIAMTTQTLREMITARLDAGQRTYTAAGLLTYCPEFDEVRWLDVEAEMRTLIAEGAYAETSQYGTFAITSVRY